MKTDAEIVNKLSKYHPKTYKDNKYIMTTWGSTRCKVAPMFDNHNVIHYIKRLKNKV